MAHTIESINGNGEAHLEELKCELKLLRTLVREVGEYFILRCEGEIETVLSHIESMPRRAVCRELPQMLKELHRLDLKPRKGRFKDLKEIHRLLGELMEGLAELQGEECRQEAGRKRSTASPSAPIRNLPAGMEPS